MAHRTTLEEEGPAKSPKAARKVASDAPANTNEERERTFYAFRRWGYLEATLDPLGMFRPLKHPDLPTLTGAPAAQSRAISCGTCGAVLIHLPPPERPRWIAGK